ncbi:MAG: class I SAM-dependent methyltransferase [Candidatus Eisenbacteria bacterium]|nr:class I SAM-dependent methyltransferase [Candidatus Eisenbacteria bacterium]
MSNAHERRFRGDPERLRSPERTALLEPDRVVALSLTGLAAASVLDVGTGSGFFAEMFSRAGSIVTGLDVSGVSLDVARGHAPGIDFVEGVAEALPFEDGSFDLVFMAHVLHESDEPLMALREARRVASRRVVVVEWPFEDEEHGPPLAHRLRPEKMERLARDAGLVGLERLRLSHMDLYRMSP